jgi:hypothetical protein
MKTFEDQDGPGENRTLVAGIDFYFEDGLMVLTRHYLLLRGSCCRSACRHCPYGAMALQEKDI